MSNCTAPQILLPSINWYWRCLILLPCSTIRQNTLSKNTSRAVKLDTWWLQSVLLHRITPLAVLSKKIINSWISARKPGTRTTIQRSLRIYQPEVQVHFLTPCPFKAPGHPRSSCHLSRASWCLAPCLSWSDHANATQGAPLGTDQ